MPELTGYEEGHMPRFFEEKLKSEYGEDSDVPFKVMNKLGLMRGSKETAKGRAADKKHKHDEQMKIRRRGSR
jgi:hypothetical protein